MVKVGKSEWGFVKFTPWSRTAAIVGAVSGVTAKARKPSGMNSTTLRICCALALPGTKARRAAMIAPQAFIFGSMFVP
jgi:hypothetical protein